MEKLKVILEVSPSNTGGTNIGISTPKGQEIITLGDMLEILTVGASLLIRSHSNKIGAELLRLMISKLESEFIATDSYNDVFADGKLIKNE